MGFLMTNTLMFKKYELTDETKVVNRVTLHRIKALRDFYNVKAGDLGGFIQKEENLSHEGNAWVGDEACVYQDSQICDHARVYENAKVFGKAWVFGYAQIYGHAKVCGDALIFGTAWFSGDLELLYDTAWS